MVLILVGLNIKTFFNCKISRPWGIYLRNALVLGWWGQHPSPPAFGGWGFNLRPPVVYGGWGLRSQIPDIYSPFYLPISTAHLYHKYLVAIRRGSMWLLCKNILMFNCVEKISSPFKSILCCVSETKRTIQFLSFFDQYVRINIIFFFERDIPIKFFHCCQNAWKSLSILIKFELSTSCRFQDIAVQNYLFSWFYPCCRFISVRL